MLKHNLTQSNLNTTKTKPIQIPIKKEHNVKLECTFPMSFSPPNFFLKNLEKRIEEYHFYKSF